MKTKEELICLTTKDLMNLIYGKQIIQVTDTIHLKYVGNDLSLELAQKYRKEKESKK